MVATLVMLCVDQSPHGKIKWEQRINKANDLTHEKC